MKETSENINKGEDIYGNVRQDRFRKTTLNKNGRIDTGARNLAEAIILQSIEDLWSPEFKGESIEFFRGEGFNICAEIAGMSTVDQLRVLHIVKSSADIPDGLL